MKSKNLKWWKDSEGKQDITTLVQTYHGQLIWSEWQNDNKLAKEMLDDAEDSFKELDKKNGNYTKVNIFLDLTDTDMEGIEPITKLYELATSTGFTHPRAGKIVLVGTNAKTEPYSKSMIRKSFEVFTKIFALQSQKLFLADTIEDAFKLVNEK